MSEDWDRCDDMKNDKVVKSNPKKKTLWEKENQFEKLAKECDHEYIEKYSEGFGQLISTLQIISQIYLTAMMNISSIVVNNIIHSDIARDYISFCVEKGLKIRHFIIRLSCKYKNNISINSIGKIGNNDTDKLANMISEIYEKKLDKYISKLKDEKSD